MILAIAALLFHLPAVPQSSLPDDSSVVGITESSSPELGSGEFVARGSPADQPVTTAALQPGRLTRTPVTPVGVDPAVDAPAPSPSSPAAAAFIASSPDAVRT